MGLDQYLRIEMATKTIDPSQYKEDTDIVDFLEGDEGLAVYTKHMAYCAYWRKFWPLQDYIKENYDNETTIYLYIEDLIKIRDHFQDVIESWNSFEEADSYNGSWTEYTVQRFTQLIDLYGRKKRTGVSFLYIASW